jgi:hypothetical protein
MKFQFINILFLIVYSTVFSQISWETPRTISTPYSKYIRTCKIERGPAAGDILMTYSDRAHGGNIWIMRSSDLGLTWTEPVILLRSPRIADGEYIFNANIIQLQDDRLMMAYQHRWDPGTVATKSFTGIRYSTDGGYTWSDEQKTPNVCVWEARPIQVHHDKNNDGHNDIYLYYTQEINPTFFRPEHCNQHNSVGRAVAYMVSYDNGVSWETNSDERYSGRIIHRNYNGHPESQGGMPTMIELPGHRIAVVAEAPKGAAVAFASWVIASDPYDYDFDNIQGDWCSVDYNVDISNASYDNDGYVIPSSVTLISDPNVYPDNPDNLWRMSDVYGNAPFTCVLPNGLVAYSQNSAQRIRVFVADAYGKNSKEVARPFSNTYRTFYPSIIPISDDMVLITAHDYDDNSQIHINRGVIQKDFMPPTTPGTPYITSIKGNVYTFEWEPSNDNIIVSHYEVWNEDVLLATTRWDNFVELDMQSSKDYSIKVRARDYQGNYSQYSDELAITTGIRHLVYTDLKVYPSIAEDYITINHEVLSNDALLIATSVLGRSFRFRVSSNERINISMLPAGIYVLTLQDGSMHYRSRIIKR